MKFFKSVIFVCLAFVLVAQAEEIHLKDGTVLRGYRLRDEDTVIVFKTSVGEVQIPTSQIVDAQNGESSSAQTMTPKSDTMAAEKPTLDPSGQTLVLMPTAFTPPEGTWNFKDFELYFLTLSYSPTSSTTIDVGTLFPLTPGIFDIFTLGIKQRLFLTPDGQGAVAVDADVIKVTGEDIDSDAGLWTLQLIGSWEAQQTIGFHAAAGVIGAFNGNGNIFSIALGTDVRITSHVKFIAEYLHGQLSSDDDDIDSDLGSIVNFGFRLYGEKLSADICGFRPLVNTDGLFLYPMLNIGYRF